MSTPCDCVHPHPKLGIWGSTCPNCTWSASAKLTVRRAGLVTVAVPVVVIGGVVVLLVAGTVVGATKVKSAVGSRRRTDFETRVRKAQAAIDEARRLVECAELEVQNEEQRWL